MAMVKSVSTYTIKVNKNAIEVNVLTTIKLTVDDLDTVGSGRDLLLDD